jgi:DNA replication protein DnaC
MDELALLKPNLKRLKLTGVLQSLDIRINQAIQEKWSYSHFLHFLLSDEIERRNNKQLQKILSRSNLEPDKTLELFDFSFNRRIPEKTIKELATCNYLEAKKVIFFVGPSGVGKSHLAQALGHEACRRGIATLYRNTYNLFKWLNAGHGDGTHERRMKQIITVPLLILDDFGLRDLTTDQQADLYEVISERYAKTSTIITSNRDFNEWPAVFSNPLMGSAAMDRLVHWAIKIVIHGNSYRLNAFIKTHKNSQPDN